MFPNSQKAANHTMMAPQNGYFGYYSGSQHPGQYSSTDLNYNYQPVMGPMSEGINGGSWANHHMYMASHPNHASMYGQRPAGYDEWSFMTSAMHQGPSSETSSPGLLPTMPSTNTSSALHQPPLTPSPCAIPNGNPAIQDSSPYYRNFCNRSTPNFGDHESMQTDPNEGQDIPPAEISIEPKSPCQPDSPYMPNWLKKSNSQNGNSDDAYGETESSSKGSFDESCDENGNTSWKVGKTRTKDKYRVVYNDNQRMELEKEFMYSRYITIKKKSELAHQLGLSERQVKIWFQNRRAKERKQTKKRNDINMDDKERVHENGLTYLQGSPFHQVTQLHHPSHPGGPPMLHPFHNFNHHKHPLMMDMKNSYALDMKHMDIKPPLSMHDIKPDIDMEMKPGLNNMN